MIFKTLDELKAVLGGAMEYDDSIRKSMKPFFDIAFDKHLSAWLSPATFDDLVAKHTADTLTAEQEALLPYVQQALGWLAYIEYSGFNDTNFGPAGRYRREDEDRKGLFKYQENKMDDKALHNGYDAIEKLVLFLEANKATHTYWYDEPGYTKHHELFLHSAEACRAAHSKRIGRYVFDIIRGKVEELEGFVLLPLLGATTYEALLTARRDDAWDADPAQEKLQRQVIALANKATLHFALMEGMRENLVRFDGNMVVQGESSESQSNKTAAKPDRVMAAERLAAHAEFGNRHLDRLRQLLTDNIDAAVLADYKAHQEALAEAAEAEQQALDAEANAESGYLSSASQRQEPWDVLPSAAAPKRKGAVRL